MSEVCLPSHGTSTALNLTHPDGVWNGFVEFGVGTPFSSRGGGENTATMSIPTIVPTNNHRSDIIVLLDVYNLTHPLNCYISRCAARAMNRGYAIYARVGIINQVNSDHISSRC